MKKRGRSPKGAHAPEPLQQEQPIEAVPAVDLSSIPLALLQQELHRRESAGMKLLRRRERMIAELAELDDLIRNTAGLPLPRAAAYFNGAQANGGGGPPGRAPVKTAEVADQMELIIKAEGPQRRSELMRRFTQYTVNVALQSGRFVKLAPGVYGLPGQPSPAGIALRTNTVWRAMLMAMGERGKPMTNSQIEAAIKVPTKHFSTTWSQGKGYLFTRVAQGVYTLSEAGKKLYKELTHDDAAK